jgi:hypothetical protein
LTTSCKEAAMKTTKVLLLVLVFLCAATELPTPEGVSAPPAPEAVTAGTA